MNQQPKKILIIGPAWIGDMVMAQTLFKLIKQRQPYATLHVLAPPWTHALLQRMPEISKAIIAPFKHGELALRRRFQLAKQLRNEKYDQAIVLPNSFKSALIPFWAHIPQRTGWRGEMRFILLNDIRYLQKDKLPLMIQRFASLGLNKQEQLPEQLPWPELQAAAAKVDSIKNSLTPKTTNKILALCPGAEYGPAKRWPAEHFAAVAKNKIADGWQVWLFGSQKDQAVAAEIQQLTQNQCIDLTGKTTLEEAIDRLSMATLVITNDTGLMHIAAALQRPLIAIYGSSSPGFTPPLSKTAKTVSLNLPCSPCFKRECPLHHFNCMRNLTPQMILDASFTIE